MGTNEIIPILYLIIILLFVFPSFKKLNLNKKQFLVNLSIWSVIVLMIVIILNTIILWNPLD